MSDIATRRRSPQGFQVRSRGAVVVDVLLLLIVLGLLPQTLELGPSAGRFPLAVTCVLLALVALDLVLELLPAARRRLGFLEADLIATSGSTQATEEAKRAEQEGGGDELTDPTTRRRAFTQTTGLVWLLAAGLGMFFLGYLVWTPIYLAAFFLWSRVPLKVAIGITVVMSSFNYLVFYVYLGLR